VPIGGGHPATKVCASMQVLQHSVLRDQTCFCGEVGAGVLPRLTVQWQVFLEPQHLNRFTSHTNLLCFVCSAGHIVCSESCNLQFFSEK
jgi:hypothetical protein